MQAALEQHQSPFHEGEKIVQQRLGVRDQMEKFGRRVIRDHMPGQHQDFYKQLPFVFVGHQAEGGWPWASMLFGDVGFIESDHSKHLRLNANPVEGDPLADALVQGTRLGLLGIELPTRRRNRLAAHVATAVTGRVDLTIDQSFGNCPQYIQNREWYLPKPDVAQDKTINRLVTLDRAARELIERSDTFFVASAITNGSGEASEGADVSHRGGQAGFVRIDDANTLTVPDYLGNNHFNTLGNFESNPKAGLLFVDFEHGHLLTITGTVEMLWDSEETEYFEGAQRLWRFHLDHGYWIENALPIRWRFNDFSPNSLLTGTWQDATEQKKLASQANQWMKYTVQEIVDESSVIKSFHLAPENKTVPKFLPGQFLTVRLPVDGEHAIRTYTVSNAPADRLLRISVKREEPVGDEYPEGRVSNYLHRVVKQGDVIDVKSPRGVFHFDASERRPAVLLAGGVGITPMVSMMRHALIEGFRTRRVRETTLISAASSNQQRAFDAELKSIVAQSNGALKYLSVLSEVTTKIVQGEDYDHVGRITPAFLKNVLGLDDYDFYLCGPVGFMQSVYRMLRGLGVDDQRIYAEEFGPAALVRDSNPLIAEIEQPKVAAEAIVEFSNAKVEQAWLPADGTLLDFAEAHGLTPDFGCRSGQCGACKVKLKSGSVSYLTAPSVELAEDEVLLCCAMPAEAAVDEHRGETDQDMARIRLDL